MSKDKLLTEEEVDNIERMAKGSSDFFGGLAHSLSPEESHAPPDKPPSTETVIKEREKRGETAI